MKFVVEAAYRQPASLMRSASGGPRDAPRNEISPGDTTNRSVPRRLFCGLGGDTGRRISRCSCCGPAAYIASGLVFFSFRMNWEGG